MGSDNNRRQILAVCVVPVVIAGALLELSGTTSRRSLRAVSARSRGNCLTSDFGQEQPASLQAWLASLEARDRPSIIVTALYDIGREAHGRTMATYLDWFAHTLLIASPVVVFVDDASIVRFVKNARRGLPIFIVNRSFGDLEYARLMPWVESVQQSEQWRSCIEHPSRLEWNLPAYISLVWSKLGLVSEVTEADPQASYRYYAWLDAGVGRWTAAAEGKPWPNVTKIKRLYDLAGDKLILQRTGADSPIGSNLKDFFCGDGAGINAGVMLATAQLANEQMVLKVWTSHNASQFAIVDFKCPGNGCKSHDYEVPVIDWLA